MPDDSRSPGRRRRRRRGRKSLATLLGRCFGRGHRGRRWRRRAAVVFGAIAIVAGVLFLYWRGDGAGAGASGSPVASGSAVANGSCPKAQPAALPAGQTRTLTLETAKGRIVIQVRADLASIATGNFVALAGCGFYNGLGFHRTATLQDGTPFVIQGGDPEGTGRGGPGYTIQDEPVTAQYARGTVAMARTQQPNSQGSQFFIVLDDKAGSVLASYNTYAIVGEVIQGMEVADAIFQASGGQETPADPVKITSVAVANP